MKKITTFLLMTIFITACQKNRPDENTGTVQEEFQSKPPSPPPTANANPAIAYRGLKDVSKIMVPAICVMDINGANQTAVYTNYTKQGNNITSVNTPDFPTWSPNGQQLCFVLNKQDLYTLDISLVNGLPVGSNHVKIADGAASGGKYGKGVWRPGANQIAAVWSSGTGPTSIRLIPSSGGAATTIYTSLSGYTINHRVYGSDETHITINQDGTRLAFFEQQVSTGTMILKVLNLSDNSIEKNIDLSQFWAITGIDWSNTQSSIIAVTAEPDRCTGATATHKLYTIDVDASTPAPVLIKVDVSDCSWSPDDSRIAVSSFSGGGAGNGCNFRQYNGGTAIITLSNNTQSYLFGSGYNPDWKRLQQ